MAIALRPVTTLAPVLVEPNPRPFGAQLRELRLQAGLSQNRLARDAGIDPAYVNRLERAPAGTTSLPSRRVILNLVDVLEASSDDAEDLLVAAGHCPQTILDAGGWHAYLVAARRAIVRALDETLNPLANS